MPNLRISRVTLERLPIFACAGFILFLFLVILWNWAVERDWPKLRIRSASPLAGVSAAAPTPWTLGAFISGETQKAFSTSLGRSLPVFPISVRVKNQLLYSLFGVSGASNLIIGRERQLFESLYVEEFCSRGAPPDKDAVDAWAARLRAIQTAVEAKGKRFIYLITPSKAARYSGYLPPTLDCPALANGRTDKLAPYLAALEAHRVAHVDGAGLTAASMANYPIDLFPRGGTHWNYLASALSARALTTSLNRDGRRSPVPVYDFHWREKSEAQGTDRDLLDLLNLLWPDARYPTAAVSARAVEACAAAPKLLAVGGSFLVQVVSNLVEAPCSPRTDYWHYVFDGSVVFRRMRYWIAPEGGVAALQRNALQTTESFEASLAEADLVLLEENESVIARMGQVADLLAAARKLDQAAPGASQ
jgi:hypothetical protein